MASTAIQFQAMLTQERNAQIAKAVAPRLVKRGRCACGKVAALYKNGSSVCASCDAIEGQQELAELKRERCGVRVRRMGIDTYAFPAGLNPDDFARL